MSYRSTRSSFALGLCFVAVASLASAALAQDPVKDLKAKDLAVRLAAIGALETSDRPDAGKLLLGVLGDKDPEVQERAVQALGVRKEAAALKPLLELALEAEFARLRYHAAEALRAIDARSAAGELLEKAKGKTKATACEALALVARGGGADPKAEKAEKLEKLLKDEDLRVREAAARAWLEVSADRAAALRQLLGDARIALAAAALDAIAFGPREGDRVVLAEVLAGKTRNDVLERRALRAALAFVRHSGAPPAGAAKALLADLGSDAPSALRKVRLIEALLAGESGVLAVDEAEAALSGALTHEATAVRAAAARALRALASAFASASARARWSAEREPRVRLQLLDTVVASGDLSRSEDVAWIAAALSKESDAEVRERIAVHLGGTSDPAAIPALRSIVAGADWAAAVCAIVSLGMVGGDEALAELRAQAAHADWKRRGAAAVGFQHLQRAEAVEALLPLLEDKDGNVKRAAYEALRVLSWRNDLAADPALWRSWWEQNRAKHSFRSRADEAEKQRRYGYDVPDRQLYENLDVIVLESRGDHMELLLERLSLPHRRTRASAVPTCGLHQEALFFSNCTGELEAGDVEPLAWFVRVGGMLFGSCWALEETIARIHPGVVRRFATREQVMDDVRATAVEPESPYLRGVFPAGTTPIYHLEGAYLIEVLDPERAEVLIDSPDAAERHGCGNLAAWFRSGHGVILDSVNHFDLQGLAVAPNLKTDRDRQIYAVDHMGLGWAKLRETLKEAFWKSAAKASPEIPDLSAFRFLTNFVRARRLGG
ncbi:MAG: HEAT repeat domain-containing protein [Planctomycetes bacterium]|nr:HEAT repeat domain-containing protein [Planctomycetota bacterium]